MSTGKDLLYLGLALLGFCVVLAVTSVLLALVIGGLQDSVVALVVVPPSFVVGAKLYLWMVRRGGG